MFPYLFVRGQKDNRRCLLVNVNKQKNVLCIIANKMRYNFFKTGNILVITHFACIKKK